MLRNTMPPATQPHSIPVHSNQLDAVDEVCSAALGCSQTDVIGQLLLLVVTGLVAVVIIAAAVHIREARATVSEERSRTATERHAFERFARKVSRFDASVTPVQPASAPGAGSAVSATSVPSSRGLNQVRTAYEETVLEMDHYEEEYDEPLAEHMRRELGAELATAVDQSQQLTPPLKQALVGRAREAARDRERLITQLDRERETLDAADDELASIADAVDESAPRSVGGWTFPDLVDEWHRLGELESRVSRLLTRRQEALQARGPDGRRAGEPSLNAYLYERLDTTFPVLTDAAVIADRVKTARRRVLLALTSRA